MKFEKKKRKVDIFVFGTGVDLGGGGRGVGRPFLRYSTPCRPKGSPLWYFLRNPFFLPTDPKIFLKTPSAPIYTNFEGERAPKKCDFFVKILQKVPKNGFFDLFFRKSNLVDLKKKRSSKFSKLF